MGLDVELAGVMLEKLNDLKKKIDSKPLARYALGDSHGRKAPWLEDLLKELPVLGF